MSNFHKKCVLSDKTSSNKELKTNIPNYTFKRTSCGKFWATKLLGKKTTKVIIPKQPLNVNQPTMIQQNSPSPFKKRGNFISRRTASYEVPPSGTLFKESALGRFFHRVAMSVYISIYLYIYIYVPFSCNFFAWNKTGSCV